MSQETKLLYSGLSITKDATLSLLNEIIKQAVKPTILEIVSIWESRDKLPDGLENMKMIITLVDNPVTLENVLDYYEVSLRVLLDRYAKNRKLIKSAEDESLDNLMNELFAHTTLLRDLAASATIGLTRWPENIKFIPPSKRLFVHPQVGIRMLIHYLMILSANRGGFVTNISPIMNLQMTYRLISPKATIWVSKLQILVGMIDSLPDLLSFENGKMNREIAIRFYNVLSAIETDLVGLYRWMFYVSDPLLNDIMGTIKSLSKLIDEKSEMQVKRSSENQPENERSAKMQKTACQVCNGTENLQECGKCGEVVYCSVECQRDDWKMNHANVCGM